MTIHYGKIREFTLCVKKDDSEYLKDSFEEALLRELESEGVDSAQVIASWPRMEGEEVVGFVAQVANLPERPFYRLVVDDKRVASEGYEYRLEFRGPLQRKE